MSELENVPEKKNGALVAIIVILLLLLALMAYLWSGKNKELNQCSSDNQQLNSDMQGMEDMLGGVYGPDFYRLEKGF